MQAISRFCHVLPLLAGLGLAVACSGGRAAAASAPTNILLNPSTLMENSPKDTLVGYLSAVDADPETGHVFSLVDGVGSDDNGDFYISGNQVLAKFDVDTDYVAGSPDEGWPIRVKVTDPTGRTFEKAFIIGMTNDTAEDEDGDGLTEAQETSLGTSDLLFDTDGDGYGDGAEVAAGISPTNPNVWPSSPIIGWGKTSEGQMAVPTTGEFFALVTGQNHSLAIKNDGTVVGWGGFDDYGQTTIPPGLTGVVAVAAGGDFWLEDSAHSLALKQDGTVVAWGYDHEGRITVPAGLDHVVGIDAGRTHCIALKDDGTVVTWGYNPHGEIEPPPGLTDVVAVSAGGYHSLALKGNGTVVGWGSNFNGSQWEEVSVPVGLSDVIAISAGRFHSMALRSDGTVVAWGYILNGQTNVPAGLGGVIAISAGGFHSLALKSDGTVVAWGLNTNGQATVPTSAGVGGGGVKAISAGVLHSLAVRKGALNAEITSSPRISAVPGVPVAFQVVVTNAGNGALEYSALGLPPGLTIDPVSGLISGTVGTPVRRSFRIQVKLPQGLLTQSAWLGVSEGAAPTAVSLTPAGVTENSPAGTVIGTLAAEDPDSGDLIHTFEWVDGTGSADNGMFRIEGAQLILDQPVTRDFEANQAGFSIRVRARDASLNPYEQSISLTFADDQNEDADGDGLTEMVEETVWLTSDTKYDWDGDGFGDGFETKRGALPKVNTNVPTGRMAMVWGGGAGQSAALPAGLETTIEVSAGGVHSLALKSDGTVLAWGGNGNGQTTVPGGLQDVIAVAAGQLHSLALKRDGTVVAWGDDYLGQCTVPEGLAGVVAISAGGYHNLALKGDGTVVAWGFNEYGQTTLPSGLTDVVAVAAGGFHSLALKHDGTVAVWGTDWKGINTLPVLEGVIAIAAGGYHSLALKHDGTVAAWGSNEQGQSVVPTGLGNVTAISAGWQHGFAAKADGTLATWGNNSKGQAGIPLEAVQIRMIAAGESHNVAIRQSSGFPAFADVSPVRGWPGESVGKQFVIQNATAAGFTAMGLPPELSLASPSGVVSGTVVTGRRRAVRITADTNQGMISRVIWFNTADGIAPTSILLSANSVMENSPAGTMVGTLGAVDPNAGDVSILRMASGTGSQDNFRFDVTPDRKLIVASPLTLSYESSPQAYIRVVAVDSGNNTFEQNFIIQLTDDRTEDGDGDGVSQAMEEDVFGTSDSVADNLNTADADKDGVSGMIEYAFNLNPKVPGPPIRLVPGANSSAGLPAIDLIPAGPSHQRLRIEYLRRTGGGVVYTPQFASGLNPADWVSVSSPITVSDAGQGWERCVVEDFLTSAQAPVRFARVSVLYVSSDRSMDEDADGINRAMEEDVFGTSDSVGDDFRTSDVDGDGLPGMIEYAFNLDPKTAGPPVRLTPGAGSTAGLPAIEMVDDGAGNLRLRIEFIRRTGSILTYSPQFAGSLEPSAWVPVANGQIQTTDLNNGWERCIVEDTENVTTSAARFGRVAVSW
jgi:alpha-tubulin suppressor-like RCC1 family protein